LSTAFVKLSVAGPDDFVGIGEAERDEQQTGLIDVAVVAVDHNDLGGIVVELAQAIGSQRAAGPRAEDDDAMAHTQQLGEPVGRAIRQKPTQRPSGLRPSTQTRSR
jgi:hypothetical protein